VEEKVMRRFIALGGALLLVCLQASGLSAWTLEEVVQTGMEHGRVPRRLHSELKAAEHSFGRTGASFLPKLTAILDERGKKNLQVSQRLSDRARVSLSAEEPADNGSPSNYGFELFLPIFRTRALELQTAKYNWLAIRLRNRQSLEDYKLSLARTFYEVLRSHSVVAIRDRTVERWDANLELARFRADIGVRSKLDYWNTKVNQANAVNAQIQAKLSQRASMDRLANLMGVEFEKAEKAEQALSFEAFNPVADPNWVRADLAAQRLQRRLAQESLQAARQAARPDLNLTLRSDKTEGALRGDTVSLSYNFQLGRKQEWHDLGLSRQALIQADIDLEKRDFDIRQEQRAVVRDLKAIARNIEVAKESLELAKLSYEASKIQFEAGRITQIELQRAQDNLTSAERTYEGFLIDYRLARFRWRRAFGGRLFE
jgi:outer membrane protein TolC